MALHRAITFCVLFPEEGAISLAARETCGMKTRKIRFRRWGVELQPPIKRRGGSRTRLVQITFRPMNEDLRRRRFLGGTARPFRCDYGLTNLLRARLILNSLPSPPWGRGKRNCLFCRRIHGTRDTRFITIWPGLVREPPPLFIFPIFRYGFAGRGTRASNINYCT
jgi:hypothetical protein